MEAADRNCSGIVGSQETKVIYHIDDETTPYLVKIPIASSQVTLRDFKMVLNKQNNNYKYFFKSMDADFGVVKEEIVDDATILPCFNGRVVSWLVSADGTNHSDIGSEVPTSECGDIRGNGRSVPALQPHQSLHHHHLHHQQQQQQQLQHQQLLQQQHQQHAKMNSGLIGGNGTGGMNSIMQQQPTTLTYQSASVLSSDLDSTSLFGTESEITLDRDLTDYSSVQRLQVRKKPRRKKRAPSMSRTSSYSSVTDSTMSLNIITVNINMEAVNFLGISIVGQSNRGGDGGIYVGSIMKGGAVALDGRIEPGDMILQVNDVNFENMTNDEAVHVLREVVQKPGPIKLVVAKCWDPNPKGYFTIPRTEPVRPIDPGAWVAHTQALTSHDSIIHPESIPEPIKERLDQNNLEEIVKAMFKSDSGLEIRDRMWLKITIPNAFIGADAVNWVLENVEDVQDRREARRIVSAMLRNNYIKHTVNKLTFSEQCYYVINEERNPLQCRSNLSHGDSESITSDIGPLPNPPIYMPYSATYNPSHGYQPIQYGINERHGLSSGSSSSDVLTSKDISASQSDITSVIHQTNQLTIGTHPGHGSNKSSGSSNRGGGAGSGSGGGGMVNNTGGIMGGNCHEHDMAVFNYVL